MAALAEDVRSPELEPSGLGHDLLVEWAPWARDERDERHSWHVRPRVDRGYHGNPPDNFWVVDKIVAPHRLQHSPYWRVAARWYLDEKSYAQITLDMGPNWPEKRIRLNLVCFAELIAREFLDSRDTILKLRNCHGARPRAR